MKHLLAAIIALFVTVQLYAQDITFQHNGKTRLNNFYADIVSKAAALNGDWGLMGGMRAGYNITPNVSVGMVGLGLIPDKIETYYINQTGRDELHLGYGGIETSAKIDITEKLYLAANVMVGAGRVDYEIAPGHDYFFITEPGASINYRITDWFGIGAAGNYRFASGVKYADFSNASFSGWSTDVSLKFGF